MLIISKQSDAKRARPTSAALSDLRLLWNFSVRDHRKFAIASARLDGLSRAGRFHGDHLGRAEEVARRGHVLNYEPPDYVPTAPVDLPR